MSSIGIKFHQSIEDYERQIANDEDIIFKTQCFNKRLVVSVLISGKQAIAIESGISVLRTKVQRVAYLETCTDARNQRFGLYDKAIKEIFHGKYTEEAFTGPNRTNPTMEMWYKLE